MLVGRGLAAGFSVVSNGYYDTIIGDSPVAYWRLGEASGSVAVDEIGVLGVNGTHTLVTLGEVGAITGDSDTATLMETGGGGILNCGSTDDFSFIQNTAVFSIEFWAKKANLLGTSWYVMSSAHNSTQKTVLVVFEAARLRAASYYGSSGNTGFRTEVDVGDAVTDTLYHYYAITGDGSDVIIYIDGIEVKSDIVTALSTGNSTGNLYIGALNNLPVASNIYNGTLDEVAIYDITLSPAQVLAHYNAGI